MEMVRGLLEGVRCKRGGIFDRSFWVNLVMAINHTSRSCAPVTHSVAGCEKKNHHQKSNKQTKNTPGLCRKQVP